MTILYQLTHIHAFASGRRDEKCIGVYLSRELAEAAMARATLQPGFADQPGNFQIQEYELDRDVPPES